MLCRSRLCQLLFTCCRPSLASIDYLAADDKIPLEHVLSLGVLSAPAVQYPKVAASRLL